VARDATRLDIPLKAVKIGRSLVVVILKAPKCCTTRSAADSALRFLFLKGLLYMDFQSYRLYELGATGSRRISELITRAKGERMVRSKTAEAGLDLDGKTLCFMRLDASSANAVPTIVPPKKLARSAEELPAEISSAAFSIPEMSAVAGTKFRHGRSRTARMSEQQRQSRVERIFEDSIARNGYGIRAKPEDMVERATNKYLGFQTLGPAFQDLIREVASL
jgi:hypothetical protein